MPRERKKHWSWSFGPYGCRVRVYERPGGLIYAELRVRGQVRYRSLRGMNRDQAKRWAREEQPRLATGQRRLQHATPTLARVFEEYLTHATPNKKNRNTQKDDHRRAELWKRHLGDSFDLSVLGRRHVEGFQRLRKTGAIDARGGAVADGNRHPVGARAVANDLEFLRAVCRPWRFKLPKEKNPKRPTATDERYERTRAVSDQVQMELMRDGRRLKVRAPLSELLDLADATGRRIGAILRLRWQDLRLDVGPYGAIIWPADTDKMGQEWAAPLNAQARAAVDRRKAERVTVLSPYLFPSPKTPRRAASKDLASAWLLEAEKLAKLPKLEGTLWHAYRRKWGCARKHLPLVDVAKAGGWKDPQVLQSIYQAADVETLQRVVDEPAEVREVVR